MEDEMQSVCDATPIPTCNDPEQLFTYLDGLLDPASKSKSCGKSGTDNRKLLRTTRNNDDGGDDDEEMREDILSSDPTLTTRITQQPSSIKATLRDYQIEA
uniref:Tyrosine recombinase XerD n=1 Tax=Lygus hesperus TaxID=30085 RepID=A0A0A9YNJ0_LYGHE